MTKFAPIWTINEGECREVMRGMMAESFDSVCTDPPYEINFMGREWDNAGVAFDSDTWREVLRLLKPGGHLLAFGGTRTFHRLACAIEDAGFEIRDCVMYMYGSGFPKSLNISKALEKSGGDGSSYEGFGTALKPAWEPVIVARKSLEKRSVASNVIAYGTGAIDIDGCRVGVGNDVPASVSRGDGGTSLSGSVDQSLRRETGMENGHNPNVGRWPANVILSHHEDCVLVGTRSVKRDQRDTGNGTRPGGFADVGSDSGDPEPNAAVYGDSEVDVYECVDDCPIRLLDEQTSHLGRGGDLSGNEPSTQFSGAVYGDSGHRGIWQAYGDKGGASRFFYTSKVSKKERGWGLDDPHRHPTAKPVGLMRYLVRLVTPPGGCVLDPFAGSGSTLIGATLEGFDCVGIEQDPEYVEVARKRVAYWAENGGPK